MVEVLGAGGGVVGVVVISGTVVVKPLSKASDSGSVYNKVSNSTSVKHLYTCLTYPRLRCRCRRRRYIASTATTSSLLLSLLIYWWLWLLGRNGGRCRCGLRRWIFAIKVASIDTSIKTT